MTVAERRDVGILLDGSGIEGRGLVPKTAPGVQITSLHGNRYVKRPRTHGFVESGLDRIPLLPLHEDLGAGCRIGTEEDRVESLVGPCLRWTSPLHQLLAAREPGCVVKDL